MVLLLRTMRLQAVAPVDIYLRTSATHTHAYLHTSTHMHLHTLPPQHLRRVSTAPWTGVGVGGVEDGLSAIQLLVLGTEEVGGSEDKCASVRLCGLLEESDDGLFAVGWMMWCLLRVCCLICVALGHDASRTCT